MVGVVGGMMLLLAILSGLDVISRHDFSSPRHCTGLGYIRSTSRHRVFHYASLERYHPTQLQAILQACPLRTQCIVLCKSGL